MANGSDIIIKGGSCEIYFDDNLYDKDEKDPKNRIHKDPSFKIKRIVIASDEPGAEPFEKDFPNGFSGKISIDCQR